jgi:hypothetical protein
MLRHYMIKTDKMKETERKRKQIIRLISTKLEIEALTKKLNSIEVDKLDKIIRILEQMEKQP